MADRNSCSLSPHPQDRLDHLARLGCGGGLVDLLEVEETHEPVDGETALQEQVDQLGHDDVRHGVALDHAHEGLAALHEGVRRQCDDGVRGGGPEDRDLAALAHRSDALLDERGQARGVEREVGAAARDALDLGNRVGLLAVDRVRRAQLAGKLEAARDDVDRIVPICIAL